MTTPIFLTGWEHAAPFTTNGTGLYATVVGTWVDETSIIHSGAHSAKATYASGAACNIRAGKSVAGTVCVQRVCVNFGATLPTGSVVIDLLGCANTPATGFASVGFNPVTGFFCARVGASGKQEDNVTVQTNTQYCVDFKSEIVGGNMVVNVKIDGRAIAQVSVATSATSQTNAILGTVRTDHSVTPTIYFDDWVVSATSADFPIGNGGIQGLKPGSDGTHSAGTNIIEDQTGNDINGTSVTAYNKLNSVPPDATTYIRQAANGSNYAEVLFENITDTHSAIIGAQACLAYTSATTTANKGACMVSKDGFSTKTDVWGSNTATADYSDGATNNLFFKTAIVSGVVDDTTVNAMTARVGYSDDASPNPYWIDLIVEVAYTTSGNDIALDLVTYPNTINAVTILENVVVSLDLVTYPNTINAVAILENIPVSLDLVTYSSVANAITVTENILIPLDLVSHSSTLNAITILENILIPLDLVECFYLVDDVELLEEGSLSLDLVTYSMMVNNLSLLESSDVDLDLIVYSNTVNSIDLLESTLLNLELVTYSSSCIDIQLLDSGYIMLDLISYSSLFNDVLFGIQFSIRTPLDRIYSINKENRTFTIKEEDRIFDIPKENRVFSIK